jgi:hypothetical protein
MDIQPDFANMIIKGALCGVVATLLGWAKSSKPGRFSVYGFMTKLPAGVLVGIIAAWQGVEFDSALTWAAGLGLVEGLDNLTKAVLRRFFPDFAYFADNPANAMDTFVYDSLTTAAILKICVGKDIDRDAVIKATEAFRNMYAKFLNLNDPQDAEFHQALSFATNQIIQNVRKDGWTNDVLIDAGKILFRMFQIYRKYRDNKVELSATEWSAELKTIIDLVQAVFKGADALGKI